MNLGERCSQSDTNIEGVCLEEIAFKWMFHCGSLQDLQKQCQQYMLENADDKMIGKRVYRFTFTIDVRELLDFDAQLGNIVCNSTEKAREIFEEACFICIQTLNWIPQIMLKSQILLQIKYTSVPHFISCSSLLGPRRGLFESGSKTMPLFTTIGIVSGMTSRSNYIQSIGYKCVDVTCETDIANGFARHYLNDAGSELQSLELLCSECGSPVEEDISCRVLGEKCLLHVLSPDGFSNSHVQDKRKNLYRSISVYVRDELINDVELGGCYSFSLIPFRELHGTQSVTTQLDLVFETNNLIKVNQDSLMALRFGSQSEATHPPSLRGLDEFKSKFRSIYSLYLDRKTSPWSFAATLAYIFGDRITPPGTYFRLKLGLLLSLVSQQSSNKNDQAPSASVARLHLLVVSKDILHIQRLLLFSKSFNSPSVVFSPCNDLCYSISKDSLSTGSCMIHSGCLPLANNGVCVLTNLNELKECQLDELESVLQAEFVNVEVPKKYIGCHQSHFTIPVRCKIWACCESLRKPGTRHQHNTYQNLQDNGRLSKALIDNFSLVFNIDGNDSLSTETFGDTLIVEDVLGKATFREKHSKYNIPDEEFFEFIKYASSKSLSFTEKAIELIQGFYLSSRRIRSSSGHSGAEFPIAGLKAMMSLAEAHARLSLRLEVSENDATLAILLYEESITARVGYSVLGFTPFHHFKDGDILTYIGLENDKRILQLKIHLKRFCSLHSNYKYIPEHFTNEE